MCIRDRVMRRAAAMKEAGELSVPALTKACMTDEGIKRNGKAAQELAKKVAIDFSRSDLSSWVSVYTTDEFSLLDSAKGFLADELGLQVDVYPADSAEYDPQNKARQAAPGRPAVLLE